MRRVIRGERGGVEQAAASQPGLSAIAEPPPQPVAEELSCAFPALDAGILQSVRDLGRRRFVTCFCLGLETQRAKTN